MVARAGVTAHDRPQRFLTVRFGGLKKYANPSRQNQTKYFIFRNGSIMITKIDCAAMCGDAS
jgi:hypothetical protein